MCHRIVFEVVVKKKNLLVMDKDHYLRIPVGACAPLSQLVNPLSQLTEGRAFESGYKTSFFVVFCGEKRESASEQNSMKRVECV